ncbi:MAG: CBS domain-containing protein [Thermoanaerobaculia bacterium]|nr:CBS domain-containing protein [Thermoanaerobaculia bacterium]
MNAVEALSLACAERFPDDAAHTLEGLKEEDVGALLAELSPETAAAILSRMATPIASKVLISIDPERAGPVIQRLAPEVAANLLRRLPVDRRDDALEHLPATVQRNIRAMLRYSPDTAGALMDPHVLSFPSETTVGHVTRALRGERVSRQYYVYVTDDEGSLEGVVAIAGLISADPGKTLGAIMTRPVIRLRHDDLVASIASHDAWWKWRALPVVEGSAVVGVLDYEKLRDATIRSPADSDLPVSLPVSLAELFWLGLIGITDGLTRVVSGERESREG